MKIIKKKINSIQDVTFYISTNQNKKININLNKYDRAIIFCDQNIKNIYADFEKKIKKKISILKPIFLKANEQTKSLSNLPYILSCLEKYKCSRNDLIIAIGGGSITDIISFTSSIYMRGIDLFLVPTTLMGQADATTAGKTCINSLYTKNIIGTYFLPKYVYSNTGYLKNLPTYELRQGMSEIFKYGLLGSKKLIKLLEKFLIDKKNESTIAKILVETIKVRIALRKRNGLISNLGHTFGHAFEKTSNHNVAHGDAISVGIVLALKFALEERIITSNFYEKIKTLMQKLELNTKIDKNYNIDQIINVMMKDKKSRHNLIGLVLIKDISKILTSTKKPFYYVDQKKMKIFLKNNLQLFSTKNHWKRLKKNYV